MRPLLGAGGGGGEKCPDHGEAGAGWLSRAFAPLPQQPPDHPAAALGSNARITAVKPAEPTSTHPLQKAMDAGLISWSGQKPVLPLPVKLNDGGPLMSVIVIEDRG